MNRFTLGLVVPITLLVAVGCSGDPTGDLRNGLDHIEASPTQLFLQPGGSKTVEVSGVDAQGNQLALAFETTNGSGITVKRDSTFQPVYVNDSLLTVPPTATRWRFIVTGLSYAKTSFTVTSGGKDITIPVQVVPLSQIQATFDKPTPALGDTVTLNAAPGTVFADTAALLIGGDETRPLTIVARAADGSSISFVPPPNVASPITITSVSSVGAPALTFSPSTESILTTPVFDTMDVNLSPATPTIGQTVTMSIPNPLINFTNFAVDTTASLAFEGQFSGPAAGPVNIVTSADSSSLSFEAPPNANGKATVTSFVFPGGYLIPLPTRTGIVTSPVLADTADVTLSNLNPAVLNPVTITLPGTIKIGAAADDSVLFGDKAAIIQSVAAGGGSVTIIPLPSSVGRARLVGVFPTGFPEFSLSMQTDDSITVPALTPLDGTDDPATAPSVTVPGVGASSSFNDAGTFTGTDITGDEGLNAQYYTITMPAAGNITITVNWVNDADVDLVVCDPDVSGALDPATCDLAAATGAQPESSTYALAAGTHFISIVLFDGDPPPFLTVTLDR